jgi:hypothetical protein
VSPFTKNKVVPDSSTSFYNGNIPKPGFGEGRSDDEGDSNHNDDTI